MKRSRRTTATSALLFALSLFAAALAHAAEVVGTVANLSGPLLAKKADGGVKILSQKSAVEQGDTLVTEKNTYARIRFVDNSEITLRPDSQLKIDNFSYAAEHPEKDSAIFSLVKGGLRSVTGLLGKRNHERFSMSTPNATIGIRGTTFIAHYVPPPAALEQAPAGKVDNGAPPPLPPGLHLEVTDGAIVVTNNGGSQGFQAGQFGYVPSINQPPVIVPPNPGMRFTPPPSFSSSGSANPASGGPARPAAVDCEVR